MSAEDAISSRVRARAAQLHCLDLPSLQQRLENVPFEILDSDETFPRSLRFVISSHCEQKCQYPDERILWCHNEGVARDALRVPSFDRLLEIAGFFLERHGVRRIKIGGLEPVLNQHLLNLIRKLRTMGIDDVSFTTHGRNVNGRLSELKAAGLTRVTISIQHFDQEGYIRLTGRDGLEGALSLVDEAQELGLTPIQINRVLLRGHTEDLPGFIEWVRDKDVTVRLFDLMWQPGHDDYYLKYLVPWQEFLPLWERDIERVVVRAYPVAWRTRVLFHLKRGGRIEVNLLQPKSHGPASVCQSCPMEAVCSEGYLGCGIRITPDLKLSPCILRGDLALSLQPLFTPSQTEAHALALDNLLNGSPRLMGQPIQLLSAEEGKIRIPRRPVSDAPPIL